VINIIGLRKLTGQNAGTAKEKILGFLNSFDWAPESVSHKEEQIVITLIAQLDIKEIKIEIKFSEKGHWIYFSTVFIQTIKHNAAEVYEKVLGINYSTTLTKFGLSPDGALYALIEMPLQTLDYEEFVYALRRLTNDINNYLIPIASISSKD